jgi:hypothetical protein
MNNLEKQILNFDGIVELTACEFDNINGGMTAEEFAYRAGYTVGVMLGGTAACVFLVGKWGIEKIHK